MKEKILVVEDDIEIAFAIKEFLAKKRYAITWTSTGKEGLEEFQKNKYDLVIVDIMMPEMDGFTLCKNIRIKSDIPILIMSAKSQEKDKVKGLNIGADDYITKPFSLVELEARIDSHIRRYKRYLGENKEEKIIHYKDGLKLYKDLEEIELDDKKLHFTTKEYSLLTLLMKNKNQVFSKKELYENIWGEVDINGNNTVTVHSKAIREKLKDDIKNPKFIETVWGSGYRFIGEILYENKE